MCRLARERSSAHTSFAFFEDGGNARRFSHGIHGTGTWNLETGGAPAGAVLNRASRYLPSLKLFDRG